MKIINIEEKKSNLLNDLRNFIEIFKKVVPYDNIKSQKKQERGIQIDSAPSLSDSYRISA